MLLPGAQRCHILSSFSHTRNATCWLAPLVHETFHGQGSGWRLGVHSSTLCEEPTHATVQGQHVEDRRILAVKVTTGGHFARSTRSKSHDISAFARSTCNFGESKDWGYEDSSAFRSGKM